MKNIPPEWWAAWITSCSDFSASDMLSITKFDRDAPKQLSLLATQLAPNLRLPEHALFTEVFSSMCTELHETHGSTWSRRAATS